MVRNCNLFLSLYIMCKKNIVSTMELCFRESTEQIVLLATESLQLSKAFLYGSNSVTARRTVSFDIAMAF